jgi:two-component system, OmpR family, sensor histidine kinase TctE
MSSRWTDSLRAQLLWWLLCPLLVLLMVNAWFSNRLAVSTANQAFDRLLLASADAIAEDVEFRDGSVVVDLPYAALQLLESNIQERIYYRVVAPDGKTLTGYDDLPLPPTAAAEGEESVLYAASYRGDSIHLVALDKKLYGTNLAAPVVVIVAETGEARSALSRGILVEGLVRQAVLIAAAVALVWFGLQRGFKPLTRLRDGLLARKASDLSPIDPAGVQTEVRPLIVALNQHTARIDALLASRQQLITDASHQMRTPLAEMRTQIEYSLRQDRPDLLRQTLVDVNADVDRLARLIGQMLLLARSDPEVVADSRSAAVNLGGLARATTLEFVAAARARHIDLGFDEPPEGVSVRGQEALLRELVANLLDNALVHGREGGRVEVRVSGAGEAVLEVEDDGPGIPAAEREKVFERFYRARETIAPGSGLGLAIVRNICLAHRAHVELDTGSDGKGLRVRVRFQRATGALA